MSTTRVREIFRTSSVIEMVVTGSTIVTERETNLSVIATTKRDCDFYDPYYDQPARLRSPNRGRNEGVKAFHQDLGRVR
jgi:hypothetical protein